MPSSPRSTSLSLDDGGSVVKTIQMTLFLGILCSMVHRVYFPNTSDLSKAEVNIGFRDSGDSITASASIRVKAPASDDDLIDAAVEENKNTVGKEITKILPSIMPDFITKIPIIPISSLPKCCQDWNPGCSWLEHMVAVICQFREDFWNMMVKALLFVRDHLKSMLSLVCDFLASLLDFISKLIQHVDCNTSSNPWNGCSSKLLRDVLNVLDAKDKIVLSWIPESTNTTGLSMITKILISISTMIGYLIIIVLCIFFENSPRKGKMIQMVKKVVFGNSPAEPSSSSDNPASSEIKNKEEKQKKTQKRSKSKSKKKNMKKESKRMVEAEEDTVAKIDVDINIDG